MVGPGGHGDAGQRERRPRFKQSENGSSVLCACVALMVKLWKCGAHAAAGQRSVGGSQSLHLKWKRWDRGLPGGSDAGDR